MIKYTQHGSKILKDGHTMFTEDVIQDLNRKVYLEEAIPEAKEHIKWLEKEIKEQHLEISNLKRNQETVEEENPQLTPDMLNGKWIHKEDKTIMTIDQIIYSSEGVYEINDPWGCQFPLPELLEEWQPIPDQEVCDILNKGGEG